MPQAFARKIDSDQIEVTILTPDGERTHHVQADAGESLNTKTMVERMLAKGLWQSNGRTPAATIYAAIIREIATKGDDARFRKVERGKFELAK